MTSIGRQPFEVTELLVGKVGNGLSMAPDDGSLVLKDSFVTIKLKDLVNGNIIINPAVMVQVEPSDWHSSVISGQTIYSVEVPHNFALSSIFLADVNTFDVNGNELSFHNIQHKANSAVIQSVLPIEVFVTMKKI